MDEQASIELCVSEPTKSLQPSPAVLDYCRERTKKSADCGYTEAAAECPAKIASFTDKVIRELDNCLTHTCSHYPRCNGAVFGFDEGEQNLAAGAVGVSYISIEPSSGSVPIFASRVAFVSRSKSRGNLIAGKTRASSSIGRKKSSQCAEKTARGESAFATRSGKSAELVPSGGAEEHEIRLARLEAIAAEHFGAPEVDDRFSGDPISTAKTARICRLRRASGRRRNRRFRLEMGRARREIENARSARSANEMARPRRRRLLRPARARRRARALRARRPRGRARPPSAIRTRARPSPSR